MRKSQQIQFQDKTAYVWGLRYRWDPSLSMNPVRRFAHFMPPWLRLHGIDTIQLNFDCCCLFLLGSCFDTFHHRDAALCIKVEIGNEAMRRWATLSWRPFWTEQKYIWSHWLQKLMWNEKNWLAYFGDTQWSLSLGRPSISYDWTFLCLHKSNHGGWAGWVLSKRLKNMMKTKTIRKSIKINQKYQTNSHIHVSTDS